MGCCPRLKRVSFRFHFSPYLLSRSLSLSLLSFLSCCRPRPAAIIWPRKRGQAFDLAGLRDGGRTKGRVQFYAFWLRNSFTSSAAQAGQAKNLQQPQQQQHTSLSGEKITHYVSKAKRAAFLVPPFPHHHPLDPINLNCYTKFCFMLIPTTTTVHDSAVAYQVKLKLKCSINLRAREGQPALFP